MIAPARTHIWTRSDVIGLANASCQRCAGLGLWNGRYNATQPCGCTLRKIFGICFSRYQYLEEKQLSIQGSACQFIRLGGFSNPAVQRFSYGRRHEEFRADFELLARRELQQACHLPGAWLICKRYFIENEIEERANRGTGLTKGQFYHEIYRIMETVGRRFFETRPYALYPLDNYFGQMVGSTPGDRPTVTDVAAKVLVMPNQGFGYRQTLRTLKVAA